MFTSESIALVAVIIVIFVLKRILPTRLFVVALVFVFALAGAGAWHFSRPSLEEAMSREEQAHLAEQQQVVYDWHAGYQEKIMELDRNWQQYHRILEDFEADVIGIEAARERLEALTKNARGTLDELEAMDPPTKLDDESYDIVAAIIMKTRTYARAELETIRATADVARREMASDDSQETQAARLLDVMARKSPAGLIVSDDVKRLRDGVRPRE